MIHPKLIEYIKNGLVEDLESGKVKSFFLVTTFDPSEKDPSDSDHVSYAAAGDFNNLIGNVEKHKQEIINRVCREEEGH